MSRPLVGVLGGTFDPVHLGHLHVASSVAHRLAFPRMLLIPSAQPPHKARPGMAAAADRVEMLRLAVEGRPGLEVCDLEVRRGGTSYTIETLRALRDGDPPCAPVFVAGLDAWLEIATWRDPVRLREEFDFAVVARPGAGPAGEGAFPLTPAPGPVPDLGRGGRAFLVTIDPMDVSSSLVRARAGAGLPLDGLVPPAVARYIQARSLYREENRP